jgi:prophage regulatory protein
MNKREKDYILYYLDQLSLKLKNNISEMQQGLSHIAEISKNISQEIPPPAQIITYEQLSTDKLAEKPPECLIRIKEVCLLVGISRSTLYKMIEEGSFPKPLDLGSRFKAWQKQTVINWIATLNSHE